MLKCCIQLFDFVVFNLPWQCVLKFCRQYDYLQHQEGSSLSNEFRYLLKHYKI